MMTKDARYKCPNCGAIHHYEPKSGCRNPKCDYTGKLEKIR